MASKIINFYDTALQTEPERLVCFFFFVCPRSIAATWDKDLCVG
jgi:hypothetical protein